MTKRLCILDLDGVLYGADPALVDSAELYRVVQATFQYVAIYTNDVSFPKEERVADLAGCGVGSSVDQIVTPIDVLFRYVMPNMGATRCCYLGSTKALPTEFRSNVVDDIATAQCIAIGDIADLDADAVAAEINGAEDLNIPIFTLNENAALVDGAGDIGQIVNRFANALSRPRILVGKPSALGFLAILSWFRVDAAEAVLVTDSMVNDAHGAAAIGVDAVLVSSAQRYPTDRFSGIDAFMRSLIASP